MTVGNESGRGKQQGFLQKKDVASYGLPPRPFLYTVDQISVILDVDEATVRAGYLHYEGRSIGFASRDQMLARNIAPETSKPDWRIAERELIRWFKRKGFKWYEKGIVTH